VLAVALPFFLPEICSIPAVRDFNKRRVNSWERKSDEVRLRMADRSRAEIAESNLNNTTLPATSTLAFSLGRASDRLPTSAFVALFLSNYLSQRSLKIDPQKEITDVRAVLPPISLFLSLSIFFHLNSVQSWIKFSIEFCSVCSHRERRIARKRSRAGRAVDIPPSF